MPTGLPRHRRSLVPGTTSDLADSAQADQPPHSRAVMAPQERGQTRCLTVERLLRRGGSPTSRNGEGEAHQADKEASGSGSYSVVKTYAAECGARLWAVSRVHAGRNRMRPPAPGWYTAMPGLRQCPAQTPGRDVAAASIAQGFCSSESMVASG